MNRIPNRSMFLMEMLPFDKKGLPFCKEDACSAKKIANNLQEFEQGFKNLQSYQKERTPPNANL